VLLQRDIKPVADFAGFSDIGHSLEKIIVGASRDSILGTPAITFQPYNLGSDLRKGNS
jgi:hypothetical protein